ncbi:MAG TPA: (2Fe-2S) ferredoxin domain-containing protein [Candidatus Nanoarchaeia archaeon]|nr:(2Fe-2S) ferredoxin domain-containing protein [Candidatus Nanoarchaeia archaeon]
MKNLEYQKPLKHVIVCVNERENEDCCLDVGGMELFTYLKTFVRNNGLSGRVWVTRSKCLGFYNSMGSTVVIYPEGKWFTEVKEEDYKKILEEIKI